VGEGGQFHGAFRTTGQGDSAIRGRVGRNAPALFNLGAKEFVRLNLGGVNEQTAAGLSLLSGRFTPAGLDNVLAGQALFPLVAGAEMLGQIGENDVVNTVIGITRGLSSFPAQWEVLVQRLRDVPEYVSQFQTVFPDIDSAQKMGISHVVNAIAAFQAAEFRSDNSPFDHYLRGDTDALSGAQLRGMDLFYNKANCASCHSGKFQSDQNFHAIAMPQFGPGAQTLGALAQDDTGRQGVTQNAADYYKFRTPSLRNVALTGPYGHTGAYATLGGVIRHHLDPTQAFAGWDRSQVRMPSRSDLDAIDFKVMDDPNRSQPIAQASELAAMDLADEEVGDLVSFLHALTDPDMLDMRLVIPASVPSGLPVGD
jgi:cytochrome c peroxidase